jgi:hypothetical protein
LSNGLKESALKIGALIVALLATSVVSSVVPSAASFALARETASHHPHRAGAAKAVAHRTAPASDGATAKRGRDNSDKINVESSSVPLPSRDNARTVKPPKLHIVKPETAPSPHTGIRSRLPPLVRNAIGQPSAISVKTGGLPAEKTSAGSGMPRQGGGDVKPTIRPSASVNLSRGKIDGMGLIRPALTAAIGGPAKSAGGINGTLLRPKHK